MAYKDPEKRRIWDRKRHENNRDERLAMMKKYRNAHLDKERARGREYSKTHRDEIRARGLKRKYGLTLEAFESMLFGQGSACAICGSIEWGSHGPTIDHNHETGDIRGILCKRCNLVLGYLRDSPQIALAVADYLEQTRGKK